MGPGLKKSMCLLLLAYFLIAAKSVFGGNVTGDSVAGDLVFSKRIPETGFGLFNIEIEARDIFGNEIIFKDREVYVLY
jgi:hypothetical protein